MPRPRGYDWESVRHRLGQETDSRIARDLGCTARMVRHKREELGIAAPGDHTGPRPRWTAAEDALLGTLPDPQVARLLGRTDLAVEQRRWKLRIPSAPTEERRSTTLTQAQIEEIRERYQRGKDSQADIARAYGVTAPTISRVIAPLKLKNRRRDLTGDVPGRRKGTH